MARITPRLPDSRCTDLIHRPISGHGHLPPPARQYCIDPIRRCRPSTRDPRASQASSVVLRLKASGDSRLLTHERLRLRSRAVTSIAARHPRIALPLLRPTVLMVIACAAALLMGCASANWSTVGRATRLPASNAATEGLAIHLDAQQRLVLSTAQGFCAEPSPDALSAYAASLGLGVSTPNEEAASIASALTSASGSIGLRTQSITLMRDALYRMCEASVNDRLAPWEVAAFLRRSQDLTAVILAIEQLTGAVRANQVALIAEAGAESDANLLSSKRLVEHAKELVKVHQDQVTAAQEKVDEATKEAARKDLSEEDRAAIATAMEQAAEDLADAKSRLERAEAMQEELEESFSGMLTNALADTGGSATFNSASSSGSAPGTKEIAQAVQKMVKYALEKDYTKEWCLSYLTSPRLGPPRPEDRAISLDMVRICKDAVESDGTDPKPKGPVEDSHDKAPPEPEIQTPIGGEGDDQQNPGTQTPIGGEGDDQQNPGIQTPIGGEGDDQQNPGIQTPIGGEGDDQQNPGIQTPVTQ